MANKIWLFGAIVLSLCPVAYPHGNHGVQRKETAYQKVAEVGDRMITVRKLTGPPPKKATEPPLLQIAEGVKSYHFLELKVYQCENGRSFVEWSEVQGERKSEFQVWSDLDWMSYAPLHSFADERSEFFVLIHPTQVSQDELWQLGKPVDPKTSQPEIRESFQVVGSQALAKTGNHFLELAHASKAAEEGSETQRQTPKMADEDRVGTMPKRATLTYWKTPR